MPSHSQRKSNETAATRGIVLAARQWRRLGAELARAHGLSEATFEPLIQLAHMEGPARQNALADAVGIEGPSLVRLVDQLEAAGLLTRAEDPSDRRAKILSLTEVGHAKVTEIESDLERLRAETFVALPDSDLDAVARVFDAIRDAAPPGRKAVP